MPASVRNVYLGICGRTPAGTHIPTNAHKCPQMPTNNYETTPKKLMYPKLVYILYARRVSARPASRRRPLPRVDTKLGAGVMV